MNGVPNHLLNYPQLPVYSFPVEERTRNAPFRSNERQSQDYPYVSSSPSQQYQRGKPGYDRGRRVQQQQQPQQQQQQQQFTRRSEQRRHRSPQRSEAERELEDQINLLENARSESRMQQFNKTKLCKFFIMGICAKNEQCQFAHDKREMRPLPKLACTKLCKTLIEKGVCRQANCTYAHCKDELRATSAFLKTKLCKFYMNSEETQANAYNTCALGDACRYAHSEAELKENLDAQARLMQESTHEQKIAEHAANASPASKYSRTRRSSGAGSTASLTKPETSHSSYHPSEQSPKHLFLDYLPQSPARTQQDTPKDGRERTSGSPRPPAENRLLESNVRASGSTALSGVNRNKEEREQPNLDWAEQSSGDLNTSLRKVGSFGTFNADNGDADVSSVDGDQLSQNSYVSNDVWRLQSQHQGPVSSQSQMYNIRGPLMMQSKGPGGLLRKGTIAANSFASLEVLAEDEPAFVALSECEEDGLKVERASIVGEQTVTQNNDQSWVVKNTFLEFKDEDENRVSRPLRNVQSASACLASLNRLNSKECLESGEST